MVQDVCALLDNAGQRAIANYGLGLSQFKLLMLVAETERRNLTTLSGAMLVSKSTITRLVDQLEDARDIERLPDSDDRRAQYVVFTPAGEACLDQSADTYTAALAPYMLALRKPNSGNLFTCWTNCAAI